MSLRLLAALGAVAYILTLLVVPLVNPSLDVLRLHPEDYVSAAAGWLVVLGYVVFALALVAVAAICARSDGIRPRIASACFAIAALTALANAIDPTLGVRHSPIEYGVFGLVLGPLIFAIGSGRRSLIVFAALAAVAIVALMASPEGTGGIVNRVFNATAATWCLLFARIAPDRRGGIMRPSGEVA